MATAGAECGWPIEPGRRVRLLSSVYDDGGDCHPPGFIGRPGDVLHVLREADWIHPRGSAWVVSHAPDLETYGGFVVRPGEVELYGEQLELFDSPPPGTLELRLQGLI